MSKELRTTPPDETTEPASAPGSYPGFLTTVLLGAMAGGMGWGIRGQYGHETGAMIAGVLLGFVVVLLLMPGASSLRGARAVALGALGIAFGGSETYGQTVGLTHDPYFVGNWPALRWGMLGLAIKGGIWWGFGGAFLGIGLGDRRWKPLEMFGLLLAMLGLIYLGIGLLNEPFDPPSRALPPIYFSADWYWRPEAGPELKPRPEVWGGLLLALAGLIAYAGLVRRDAMALRLGLIGFVAGAIGFPVGQGVQAYHAWHREWFQEGPLRAIEPHMNWWNMMEITFGAIGGAGLAWGARANRRLIAEKPADEPVTIPPTLEFLMVAVHLVLLVGAEFGVVPGVSYFIAFGPVLAILALPGVVGGRFWPYLMALPIVAVPIAGKTLRNLSYESTEVARPLGWVLLVAVPLAVALLAALWLERQGRRGQPAGRFAAIGLLVATWLYFGLNFAFFHLPWPWAEWTRRTPSAIIFIVCAAGLTAAAARGLRTTGTPRAAAVSDT